MSDSNGTSNGNGTAAPASNGSPEQLKVEEKKGGVKYDVILDHAKSPARPQASPMTTSVTTLEDCEGKLKAAEERRKTLESEKLQKLSQAEKHAQEVREKKEKIKANGDENGQNGENGEKKENGKEEVAA